MRCFVGAETVNPPESKDVFVTTQLAADEEERIADLKHLEEGVISRHFYCP